MLFISAWLLTCIHSITLFFFYLLHRNKQLIAHTHSTTSITTRMIKQWFCTLILRDKTLSLTHILALIIFFLLFSLLLSGLCRSIHMSLYQTSPARPSLHRPITRELHCNLLNKLTFQAQQVQEIRRSLGRRFPNQMQLQPGRRNLNLWLIWRFHIHVQLQVHRAN